MGLFPIVQTSIDGRWYSSRTRLHGNHSTFEAWWTSLCFIVSCVSPVEWPTRTSDKKSVTQITAQGNETLGLYGSSSRQQCWSATLSGTAWRKTWYRNLEYSTDSEPEHKKRLENLAVAAQQSGSWAGAICSTHLCFLDVVPYKEDMTPSLFRTRFVGCYALPCISIKLWRSTCKPYSKVDRSKEHWLILLEKDWAFWPCSHGMEGFARVKFKRVFSIPTLK